jgi:hypothetical protein
MRAGEAAAKDSRAQPCRVMFQVLDIFVEWCPLGFWTKETTHWLFAVFDLDPVALARHSGC